MSLIFQTKERVQGRRNGIYVGGREDAKDLTRLKTRSITHVLNLTPPKDVNVQAGVPNFFESELTYKRIPIYDSSTSVPALREAIDDIVDFISKGLCHGSVLVHCQKGASRSVTAAAAYLIRREKMTLDAALEMIRRRRPTAQPIPAFLELLKCIEEVQEKTDKIGCDIPGSETRAEVADPVACHSQPLDAEAGCEQLVDAAASRATDTKEAGTLDEAMPKRRRIIGPSRGP